MIIMYSFKELLLITLAAIVVDAWIGDPRRLPHPVVGIGWFIQQLEKRLQRSGPGPRSLRWRGVCLTFVTLSFSFGTMWLVVWLASSWHIWLGYGVSCWFVATTIAGKGLRDAAYAVYEPLMRGDLAEARLKVGWIVGRDTAHLNESEVARAAVETVAENTVDAFVSPVLFALIGGAPFAMMYRAANTLDSMVGYKNDKYRDFGWASARFDDVLNWIPARLTGCMLSLCALAIGGTQAARSACRSIRTFAHLHPSPNSGIPESAIAGALGIELGGRNLYGGVVSERARMGWARRPIEASHILASVRYLALLRFWMAGGIGCLVLIGSVVL